MESRRAPFFFLLLLVSIHLHISGFAEARPLSLPSVKQERYVKVLESLGLVCRCCDGVGGECRSTWESTCAKLDCNPWKSL